MLLSEKQWKFLYILGTILLSAVSTVGTIVWTLLQPSLTTYINRQLPSSPLLILSVALTALLLIALIALFISYNTKLKFALGVYWDKEENPYCPACKVPLTNYGNYQVGTKPKPGFKCVKCDSVIRISDGGTFLNVEQARKTLKRKK